MEYKYLFDNQWFLSFWTNYSMLILMVPTISGAVLKVIAKVHPGVPSDEIMELIKVFCTKPGDSTPLDKPAEPETK